MQPRQQSISQVSDTQSNGKAHRTALETRLQKTKVCRYHMQGLCKHGSECRFAHGAEELATQPNLTKTRMCPELLNSGSCERENCSYAHDLNELKTTNFCYKTSQCMWFAAGKCRNGAYCSFAHGNQDAKPPPGAKPRDAPVANKVEPVSELVGQAKANREPMFVQPQTHFNNLPQTPSVPSVPMSGDFAAMNGDFAAMNGSFALPQMPLPFDPHAMTAPYPPGMAPYPPAMGPMSMNCGPMTGAPMPMDYGVWPAETTQALAMNGTPWLEYQNQMVPTLTEHALNSHHAATLRAHIKMLSKQVKNLQLVLRPSHVLSDDSTKLGPSDESTSSANDSSGSNSPAQQESPADSE